MDTAPRPHLGHPRPTSGGGSTPDSTAVRVALWRALHREVDAAPPVIDDHLALPLVDPDPDWRQRPDMDPTATRGIRAAIVARARFIEDLVVEAVDHGVDQYVLLGAGLDTFAQRRTDLPAHLEVFEIEQPETQAWKRRRLGDLGHAVPERLHLVGVDFEAGQSWWDQLVAAGFDPARPAVVASTGVSMYLSRDTTAALLRQAAQLAPGSTVAMTFLLPADLIAAADRPTLRASTEGARASGTPFVSFYRPDEVLDLARAAGFTTATHLAGTALGERYFTDRDDELRPSSGEDFLLATTPHPSMP